MDAGETGPVSIHHEHGTASLVTDKGDPASVIRPRRMDPAAPPSRQLLLSTAIRIAGDDAVWVEPGKALAIGRPRGLLGRARLVQGNRNVRPLQTDIDNREARSPNGRQAAPIR